jgi:hypothetical protein
MAFKVPFAKPPSEITAPLQDGKINVCPLGTFRPAAKLVFKEGKWQQSEHNAVVIDRETMQIIVDVKAAIEEATILFPEGPFRRGPPRNTTPPQYLPN